MKSHIDASGRLVIPKKLREAAGIAADTEIDITEKDGALLIKTVSPTMPVRERDGILTISAQWIGPDNVSQLIRSTRAEREAKFLGKH